MAQAHSLFLAALLSAPGVLLIWQRRNGGALNSPALAPVWTWTLIGVGASLGAVAEPGGTPVGAPEQPPAQ
jgi:hypothetical protein